MTRTLACGQHSAPTMAEIEPSAAAPFDTGDPGTPTLKNTANRVTRKEGVA